MAKRKCHGKLNSYLNRSMLKQQKRVIEKGVECEDKSKMNIDLTFHQ